MATEPIKIVLEAITGQAKAELQAFSASITESLRQIESRMTATTAKMAVGMNTINTSLANVNKALSGVTIATKSTTDAKEKLTAATKLASNATRGHAENMNFFQKSSMLAIVQMMALYSVMRMTIGGITTLFRDAFSSVEDYRMSIIKISALITTFSEKSKFDLAGAYKEANIYAKELVNFLELIDRKTLATSKELLMMAEVMATHRVALDMGNKEAVQGYINIANALKTVSRQSQNSTIQIRQELRGLLTGDTKEVSELAKAIDQNMGGSLKKYVEQWKQSGTFLENMGKAVIGFGAASEDFESTWEAIGTTLSTVYNKTLRGAFIPVYEEILSLVEGISDSLMTQDGQLTDLATTLQTGMQRIFFTIRNIIEGFNNIFNGWNPLLQEHNNILSAILKGWMYIIAVLPEVGIQISIIIQSIQTMSITAVNGIKMLTAAAVGQWAIVNRLATENKKAWDEFIKKVDYATHGTIDRIIAKWGELDIKIQQTTSQKVVFPTLIAIDEEINKIKEKLDEVARKRKEIIIGSAAMLQEEMKEELSLISDKTEQSEKIRESIKKKYALKIQLAREEASLKELETNRKTSEQLSKQQAKYAEDYIKKYKMDNADLYEKLELQRKEDLEKVGANAEAKKAIWATYYKKVNELDQNFHMSIDISDRFSVVKLKDTLDESLDRFSVNKEKMEEISKKTDFSITNHMSTLYLKVDQDLYEKSMELSQKLYQEKIDKINKNREINMATNLAILKDDKATAEEKLRAMEELNHNLNASNMSLMQSFKIGWKSAEENWHSTTLLMAEMAYDMANSSKNYIANYLFEGLKGHMRSFADFWTGFWKMLRDIFLRTIAEMVAQAIMFKIGFQDIIGSILGAIGLGGGGGGTAKNIVGIAAGALLPKVSIGGEGGGVSIGGAGAAGGLLGGSLVDIAYSVADAVSKLGISVVSDAAYAIADSMAEVGGMFEAGLGGIATAGGLGFIGGNIISKLFGKRGPAGGIGGGVGAMAGMAVGGPLGAIAGGLLGAIGGALGFGKSAPSVFEGLGIKATDEARGIQALDASIRALVDGSLNDFKVGLTVIAEALDDTIQRVNYGKVNFGEFEGVMQIVGSTSERYLNILKEQAPTSDMANAAARQLIASIVEMSAQTQNATGVTLDYRTRLIDMALALLQNASQSGFTAAQIQYLTNVLSQAKSGAFDFGKVLEWLNSIQLTPKTIDVKYNVASPPAPTFHYGGIIKAHGGWYTPMISADEQMIVAQRGEFITRRGSVNEGTLSTLEHINRTGSTPQQPINVIINLKGGAIDDPAYWDKIVRWYIQPAINRNSGRRV